MTNILIVVLCISALAGGLVVVLAKNPTRNLFGLFATTISVGILFLLLGGAYLAMLLIMVYAGAILMLFLFVVKYFGRPSGKSKISWQAPLSFFAVLIVFFQVVIPVYAYLKRGAIEPWDNPPDIKALGILLYSEYVYPFELISVLILVAIVGAIYMVREELGNREKEDTE